MANLTKNSIEESILKLEMDKKECERIFHSLDHFYTKLYYMQVLKRIDATIYSLEESIIKEEKRINKSIYILKIQLNHLYEWMNGYKELYKVSNDKSVIFEQRAHIVETIKNLKNQLKIEYQLRYEFHANKTDSGTECSY